jgi:hypothetical protein
LEGTTNSSFRPNRIPPTIPLAGRTYQINWEYPPKTSKKPA